MRIKMRHSIALLLASATTFGCAASDRTPTSPGVRVVSVQGQPLDVAVTGEAPEHLSLLLHNTGSQAIVSATFLLEGRNCRHKQVTPALVYGTLWENGEQRTAAGEPPIKTSATAMLRVPPAALKSITDTELATCGTVEPTKLRLWVVFFGDGSTWHLLVDNLGEEGSK
jgi:hypothetical protein